MILNAGNRPLSVENIPLDDIKNNDAERSSNSQLVANAPPDSPKPKPIWAWVSFCPFRLDLFSFLNELPFRFWRFLYRMVPFLNISIISLVRLASSGCSRMSSRFTQAAYFSSPLSMVMVGSPSRSQ